MGSPRACLVLLCTALLAGGHPYVLNQILWSADDCPALVAKRNVLGLTALAETVGCWGSREPAAGAVGGGRASPAHIISVGRGSSPVQAPGPLLMPDRGPAKLLPPLRRLICGAGLGGGAISNRLKTVRGKGSLKKQSAPAYSDP